MIAHCTIMQYRKLQDCAWHIHLAHYVCTLRLKQRKYDKWHQQHWLESVHLLQNGHNGEADKSTKESYSSTEKHLIGFKIAIVFLSSLKIDKLNYGSETASTLPRMEQNDSRTVLLNTTSKCWTELERDSMMKLKKIMQREWASFPARDFYFLLWKI